MISTIFNMPWILGRTKEWEEFCKSFLKRFDALRLMLERGWVISSLGFSKSEQWLCTFCISIQIQKQHRQKGLRERKAVDSLQFPKPICFHLTLARQGSKSKCWKPSVSTITFKPDGVLKALIIPVKPFMKRMAITDLAGMHCQLHETRNKKQAIARWKGPECVSSSFISLSCSCYIQKPFRYPTNVDHANCYVSLFFYLRDTTH